MTKKQQVKSSIKKVSKAIVYGFVAISVGIAFSDIALAFDLDRGITAGTNPIITAIETHWGKGVIIGGVTGALTGGGPDFGERAKRAGIGAGIAGTVITFILAGFGS